MEALERLSLRYKWASRHLHQLHLDCVVFLRGVPYEIRREQYTEGDEEVVELRLHMGKQLPPFLPLMVGDCIHNLRSMLDHMTWELAQRNGKPQQPRNIAFPIFLRRDGGEPCFDINGKRMICELPADTWPIFDRLQPYNRRNDPTKHPLWILNELWNIDKHRSPHLIGYSMPRNHFLGIKPNGILLHADVPAGAFDENPILARFHLRRLPPGTEVEIEGKFEVEIVFNEAGPVRGRKITEVLQELYNFVADKVVPPFRPFLS